MTDRISLEEMERVATEAAKKAVTEILLMMGVNIEKPDDIQAMQADFRHLRMWRNSVDAVRSHSLKTVVVALTTGVMGAIWLYVQGKH